MKIGIEYTLTGGDPVTVAAGPKAISAAEKAYTFKVAGAASDGLSIESLAYMAWTQAVRDAVFLGPWAEFWDRLDDLNVVPVPDPIGAVPVPSPGP